ncbi:MAG: hypothetical protein V1899_08200 [Planctomycetota bacterium]
MKQVIIGAVLVVLGLTGTIALRYTTDPGSMMEKGCCGLAAIGAALLLWGMFQNAGSGKSEHHLHQHHEKKDNKGS